jgi:FixJ family two-component response regulator
MRMEIGLTLPPLIHVIDDDPSLRVALSRLLTASGYRVALYESAGKFLEGSVIDRPSCILLDVSMPDLDGLQLLEQLNEANDRLPIIFLTGNGNIPMSVRAIKAGAEDFLAKPVQKEDLLCAIESALANCRKLYIQREQIQKLECSIKQLTIREQEVFNLLILGMLNKQVGFALGMTERTVKAHRRRITEKLGVKSIAEMVLIATRLGLLSPS